MNNVIDFAPHLQKVKNDITKMTDDEKLMLSARHMQLNHFINISLMKYQNWIMDQADGKATIEKAQHFYNLLNCGSFTTKEEGRIVNNCYIYHLTKWQLFKMLIGVK